MQSLLKIKFTLLVKEFLQKTISREFPGTKNYSREQRIIPGNKESFPGTKNHSREFISREFPGNPVPGFPGQKP